MSTPEHVDVLIVGGGLAGIGAAQHVQRRLPGRSLAILEARATTGGTWDLFRYPGVRSDSDMHTYGYAMHPWTDGRAIADGDSVLDYVRGAAAETGIDRHIRLEHRVTAANWSSEQARWTVDVARGPGRDEARFTCRFLLLCSGYYRYDEGYTPALSGIGRFNGTIVHPQHWPEDLDYAGKQVVVIGSGATAVTIVPAMTDRAAHVTMLQRSPSYVIPIPRHDPLAGPAMRLLGRRAGQALVRRKNVAIASLIYRLSRRRPHMLRRLIRAVQRPLLPKGYAIDRHFNPSYDPWDQRLCMVADGDLFTAIRDGSASVVTDRIATFTEDGLLLESGDELAADIVVTATGLNLLPLGGIDLSVDGSPVALPDTMAYRGLMLSGIPNLVFTVGYTNGSWTLRADLVAEYTCRLIAHMDDRGHEAVVPVLTDPSVEPRPLLAIDSGYVHRSVDRFPVGGSASPWQLGTDYRREARELRHSPIDDPTLRFSGAGDNARPSGEVPIVTRSVA